MAIEKLIIIQENLDAEILYAITKELLDKLVSHVVIVLNKNFDETEEFLLDNFKDTQITLMRDYFFNKCGIISSIYTGLEDIENDVYICIPSNLSYSKNQTFEYRDQIVEELKLLLQKDIIKYEMSLDRSAKQILG